MASGHSITFQFPSAGLFILLLIPFFVGHFVLTRYRQKQQNVYASSHLLPHLLIARASTFRRTKIVVWALIWILACLALMDPLSNVRYLSSHSASLNQPQVVPHEIIFLVDTSASMLVPDGYDKHTRLESAKSILKSILRQLQGQTVSLYAFTSQTTHVVPPTLDYLFTRLSIEELHINQGNVGGTRLAPVLNALKEQASSKIVSKYQTVILLTDGGDTKLGMLKESN